MYNIFYRIGIKIWKLPWKALGPKALPYLERTVQNSKDAHIRALAIQAMGLIGSKDVMGTLVLALRDTDERVRDAAAYSLNQIF